MNNRTGKHVVQTTLDSDTIRRYMGTQHPRTVGAALGTATRDIFLGVNVLSLRLDGELIFDARPTEEQESV